MQLAVLQEVQNPANRSSDCWRFIFVYLDRLLFKINNTLRVNCGQFTYLAENEL